MNGGEIISKVASYIMLTIMIILGVVLVMAKVDASGDVYVTKQASGFIDTCRTTGTINPQEYEAFVESIYRLDCYDVDIAVQRRVTYPDGTGTGRTDYVTVNMDSILDDMFGDGTFEPLPYSLNAKDQIYITITRTKNGMGTSLLSLVSNMDETGTIVCNYGGMVGEYGN